MDLYIYNLLGCSLSVILCQFIQTVVCVNSVLRFFLLSSTPWYWCNTICLIHPLKDIWAVSSLCLLQIKQLWIDFSVNINFHFSGRMYKNTIAGSYDICYSVIKTAKLFPEWLYYIYRPTSNVRVIQFLHMLISIYCCHYFGVYGFILHFLDG